MNNSSFEFTILPLSAAVALLATATVAYFLGRRFKSWLPPVLIAGLALPTVIMMVAFWAATSDEPDGRPPGVFLEVALSLAEATALVTLVLSGLVVRLTRR